MNDEARNIGDGLPDKEFVATRKILLDLLTTKISPVQAIAQTTVDEAVDEIGCIWMALCQKAEREAILGLHDSIMRGELKLSAEPDQAFNFAHIHRWLEEQAQLKLQDTN